jgi:transposase
MVKPAVCARRATRPKIGIVAVARRLVIDLWRYLDAGVIPDGAVLKGRSIVASGE